MKDQLMEKMVWYKQIKPMLHQAGALALTYYGSLLKTEFKKTGGFVTEVDLKLEQLLIKSLQAIKPDAGIIAEESGNHNEQSEYVWVIDPLDGTTNFAHGLGYFCISVALTRHGQPVMGAIYDPLHQKLWYAEKGHGAWLNEQKITVSAGAIKRRVISVGVPYQKEQWGNLMPIIERICTQSFAIRHFGAIALDLAHVAAGNLDGAVFFRLSWWDIAAGVLLVQEAGGAVTDLAGKQIGADYPSCVAGAPEVQSELLRELDHLR